MLTGYHIGDSPLSWNDAEDYCQQYGSHLATINSSFDHEAAKALCDLKEANCWIGLKYDDTENAWQWADESELGFVFNSDGTPMTGVYPWRTSEPNNADEDCIEMFYMDNYQWNDQDCQDLSYPICTYGTFITHRCMLVNTK